MPASVEMLSVRPVTRERAEDLNLRNDPFLQPGRLIPRLEEGVWSYRIDWSDSPGEMAFPQERYDYEALAKDSLMLGAYRGDTCLGLAIYHPGFFNYMYLLDLKVSAAARRQGVGRALIRRGMEEARDRDYGGVYLQAQDNNLGACLFYLSVGFRIGGFDNRVYTGSPQAGKGDILFYGDWKDIL